MSQADLPASLSGPGAPAAPPDEAPGFLARLAERFTAWAERWIPDAFVFALVATVLVVVAAYVTLLPKAGAAEAAVEVATIWGSGFWELLSFTLQMALIIITGYVVATTRPVFRLIVALAQVPKSLHPQPGREAPRRVGCGPPAAHPPACHRSASAGPRRLTQPPAP
ncbi:MAG: TIGR00366 family protein, partial [Myxococcales bacterium]|nr:TIGR00366 family protein [Myxococcales bacterium]